MNGKIDWDRLCETPVVKLGHRIAAMLLVPIMLGVGYAFIDMRDTITRLPDKLDRIEARQGDFEQRIRSLERRE